VEGRLRLLLRVGEYKGWEWEVKGRREEERREEDIISYLKRSAKGFLGVGVFGGASGVGLCGFEFGKRREKGEGRRLLRVRSERE
jgi:hypothetical protein